MLNDPIILGLLFVMVAGISGASLVVLMVKFFERRDRRRAGQNPTS
jgi:hypothetical protein